MVFYKDTCENVSAGTWQNSSFEVNNADETVVFMVFVFDSDNINAADFHYFEKKRCQFFIALYSDLFSVHDDS